MDELLSVESREERQALARTLAQRMLARRGQTVSPWAIEQKARVIARLIRVQSRLPTQAAVRS